MSESSPVTPNPSTPEPTPPFQFSLRTLLLLFVLLASSLAVFGAWGIVVFGLVVGLAIYLHEAEPLWSWARLALVVIVLLGLAALLMPGIETHRESSRRTQCLNNLHLIASALQAYHQANGCFPPAYIADKNGKPMHSWRVLILPYLDQSPLYAMYRFSEPWDGPNNKKLLAYRLPVFECPSAAPRRTQTSYVAVVGSNAAWAGEKPRKADAADFPGGLSKTIMLVEMPGSDIAWTEPRDMSLDSPTAAGAEPRGLAVTSNHKRADEFFFKYTCTGEVNVAMADGSVRCLPWDGFSTDDLRNLLRIGGYPDEAVPGSDGSYKVRYPNWPNIAALAVWLLSVGTLLTQAVQSRKARSCETASVRRT